MLKGSQTTGSASTRDSNNGTGNRCSRRVQAKLIIPAVGLQGIINQPTSFVNGQLSPASTTGKRQKHVSSFLSQKTISYNLQFLLGINSSTACSGNFAFFIGPTKF